MFLTTVIHLDTPCFLVLKKSRPTKVTAQNTATNQCF